MSRAQDRTFSFDNDDEISLNANRRNFLSQDNNAFPAREPPPSPYTDSPSRNDNDSPPPPPVHSQFAQATDVAEFQSPRPRVRVNTNQARDGAYGSRALDHSTSNRTTSTITPGADNMGERAAGGGINGIAMGVADTNERESGVQALQGLDDIPESGRGYSPEPHYDNLGTTTTYARAPPKNGTLDPFASPAPSRHSNPFDDRGCGTSTPGDLTPWAYPSSHSIPMSEYPTQDAYGNVPSSYSDNPYNRFSTWDPHLARGEINPDDIDDEGDEMPAPPIRTRRSILGLSKSESSAAEGPPTGTAGAPTAGGLFGGFFGRKVTATPSGMRDASGQYGAVPGSSNGLGQMENMALEKTRELKQRKSRQRKLRWLFGIVLVLAVIGAILGGVIGALTNNKPRKADSPSSSGSATPSDKDLDLNSPEIKKLMGNPNLHKVFPGMDYTPYNAQYPACLSNMPSQDNVTMDVAVLSQLTNAIRLYGTDCNQTEMVLHAINKLQLTSMKVWLGVWLDSNTTTNTRGLNAMYDILSKNGAAPFAGIIVGNEVLYRKDLNETALGDILSGVKTNLTNQKIDLPVATSDLGDDWTAGLEADTDVVMSNIHPFFAGVNASIAAGWTWDFWQQHDTLLTKGSSKQNVISETGWPSGGGTDCGEAATCTVGSVAGIDEMNTFMDAFVCQSLQNGTTYFWFEAFDEPWKESLNTPGKEWEDKWGLMDPGRNLKPGLIIPDCGGNITA